MKYLLYALIGAIVGHIVFTYVGGVAMYIILACAILILVLNDLMP
jgi:hypothetical protein